MTRRASNASALRTISTIDRAADLRYFVHENDAAPHAHLQLLVFQEPGNGIGIGNLRLVAQHAPACRGGLRDATTGTPASRSPPTAS